MSVSANTIPIESVPKDIDPTKVGTVKNPMKEDFVHSFDGQELIIPAGGDRTFALQIAVHMAKHLAEKMIRAEHRAGVDKIKDEKKRDEESRKSIPQVQSKIWGKMKEIVETDSDFFENAENEKKIVRKN